MPSGRWLASGFLEEEEEELDGQSRLY